MSVNTNQIRTDLKETAVQIRALKAIFRESGQPRLTWRVRDDLWALKQRATDLCIYRAHLRGKLHMPAKMDKDAQTEYITNEKWLSRYDIPDSTLDTTSSTEHSSNEALDRLTTESNDLNCRGFESHRAQEKPPRKTFFQKVASLFQTYFLQKFHRTIIREASLSRLRRKAFT